MPDTWFTVVPALLFGQFGENIVDQNRHAVEGVFRAGDNAGLVPIGQSHGVQGCDETAPVPRPALR